MKAGFDKSKSTIYTLEGVSQYIPKESLDLTLKELAKLNPNSNSKIFISYVNKLLLQDSKACFGIGYLKPEKAIKFITNDSDGIIRHGGEIFYYENRAPVTRAADQKEDIKVILQF